MELFFSLSTLNNFSSSIQGKEEDIITGSVDEGPGMHILSALGVVFLLSLVVSTLKAYQSLSSTNSSKYPFL